MIRNKGNGQRFFKAPESNEKPKTDKQITEALDTIPYVESRPATPHERANNVRK